MRMRRVCGYCAALAVTPYLLIKIAWTFGIFVPTEQMREADWRAINATTAVLAGVGVLLAMALSRPWGERLPAWLVALPVWVGTGLLVPMVLLAPVLGLAAIDRDEAAGAPEFWVYEQVFIMIPLVGTGVCLPIALVGYVRARWPEALSGAIHPGKPPTDTRELQVPLARLAAAGAIVLGSVKVFWAAGGTAGLDSTRMGNRDLWWHLLTLSTGAWAFAGAWGVLALTSRRTVRRFVPPMVAAWIASGALFSYGLYDLLTQDETHRPAPEYSAAYVLTREAGVILGMTAGRCCGPSPKSVRMHRHGRRQKTRSPAGKPGPPGARQPNCR